MKQKSLSMLIVGLLLAVGCSKNNGSTGSTATVASTTSLPCLSLMVPAYFYPTQPTSPWNTVIADAPWNAKVARTMILNPNSGPGTAVDPTYQATVAAVHKAGGKLYGYVPTGYGADAMATVETEIQEYISWYGVDGIFLDEASEDASMVSPYYQPLATYITSRIPGGGVILNPGVYPDASYAAIAVPVSSTLRIVVFEHDYATFTSSSSVLEPTWAAGYPPSMFINIVYDTSAANVANVLTVSIARNVDAVYVTDQTLPNPYAVLPSYWSTLTQSTQAGC